MPRDEKENVTVSVEVPVLAFVDRYCKKHDLTRSQVFTRGVKLFLAVDLALSCFFWRKLYDSFFEDDNL